MNSVRTRFAPSPTGFLHVGGIRTALFAWLVARQANGTFILRIEDTDQAREVQGSADHIQECLKWLGLEWDEGPTFQSQNLDIYKKYAQKLIDSGRAYADPYSPEELQELREKAKAEKRPFLFRDHRPENPPAWDGTQPLRFKSDPKPYKWNDAVLGELSSGPEVVDDFIIVKSDGFPTYNFAHIVDDHEMGVTHVIRSQEFLSSVPKYLNLYEALEITPPVLATPPFVMGPDGKKKLSKRDGAKDILDYAADGYLPEAMFNFLVTLGWNDGTEQEIFSREEVLEKFSLERVQRSGARFDEKRLEWMNGQWIRRIELDDLYKRVADFWPESAKQASEGLRKQVSKLVQERLKTLADLPALTSYFFEEPNPNVKMIKDNKQLSKLSNDELKELLNAATEKLEATDFTEEALTNALNELLEQTDQKPAVLFGLLRFALTWAPFSPGLAETMAILGKETSLKRLKVAYEAL